MHYSLFIARIRQNIDRGMPIEQAIDESISYCIRHDILKDVLLKNRSEVRHMLLTEFDEKKFAKSMWKEGHESGYTEGHDSGYTEGRESILEILDAINRGNDTVEKLTYRIGLRCKNGTRGIGEEINRNNNGYAVSEENFKTGIFHSKMTLVRAT